MIVKLAAKTAKAPNIIFDMRFSFEGCPVERSHSRSVSPRCSRREINEFSETKRAPESARF